METDKKSTQPLNEVLPIDEWEKLHLPELSEDVKCHIENYVESPHDVYALKRMIFQSIRQHEEAFDNRPTTIPNLGINRDSSCAYRYRKISRQVARMGGWANFEHYVNHSFVNEANEFNKLAMFVEKVMKAKVHPGKLKGLKSEAKKLIEGLK